MRWWQCRERAGAHRSLLTPRVGTESQASRRRALAPSIQDGDLRPCSIRPPPHRRTAAPNGVRLCMRPQRGLARGHASCAFRGRGSLSCCAPTADPPPASLPAGATGTRGKADSPRLLRLRDDSGSDRQRSQPDAKAVGPDSILRPARTEPRPSKRNAALRSPGTVSPGEPVVHGPGQLDQRRRGTRTPHAPIGGLPRRLGEESLGQYLSTVRACFPFSRAPCSGLGVVALLTQLSTARHGGTDAVTAGATFQGRVAG